MKAFLFLILLSAPLSNWAQKSKPQILVSFQDRSSELWGFKTPRGKVVIPAKYIVAFTDTLNRLAFVADRSRLLAIDRHGKFVLEPYNFDNGPDYLSEGLFRFVDKDKMGFANMDG